MNPFVFVLFGATGDLAKNKLFPALFSLFKQGLLGEKFYLVGFSRREIDDTIFRQMVRDFLKLTDENPLWQGFSKNIYYQNGLFDEEKGYLSLIERLNGFDKEIGACISRVFYLATPPQNYHSILDRLHATKLSEGCGQGSSKWTKIAIEKPFGKDLETAKALDMKLSQIFEERQIFRVDHYLSKETVQNMIAFRFANGIFEPVWNNKFIDHVQVTFAEKKGIEKRGKFFDGVGMLRDVAQNHLLQLVATVTMEQPRSFAKEDVRNARVAAIQAIACIESENVAENVVSGQYEGYLSEKDVDSSSVTETFVAMKFGVNTPRFQGVPFYVRAGKNMPANVVEISIVFIQTCHILFKEMGCPEIGNVLTIRIQPDEGIRLRVIAKHPGAKLALDTVDMKFSYHEEFGTHGADAYEKVLMDIFSGDQMLFNRSDELESSWEFITKILDGWKTGKTKPVQYSSGTWGPYDAEKLIERDNRKWL
ncbi:MAG: glucose-6-phosphate dehydrogenase [bacterium]|nr:glucose-6-phosphate dehydrogenase [bacterium]